MDHDEFDEEGPLNHLGHMAAGSCAGVMEHLCMFPVDTIKTRLQVVQGAGPAYRGVVDAAQTIARVEGPLQLYVGLNAIVAAAIPSHAMYFAVYEAVKHSLIGNSKDLHPTATAMSGACATMAHDFITTPLDVVKQRLQMHNSAYSGMLHTIRSVYAQEGLRAFYASYPVTVMMNMPFVATHFTVYESLRHFLAPNGESRGPLVHFMSGAGAGAVAGAISNPLDVVKTRLQTQGRASGGKTYKGMAEAARAILKEDGMKGFSRGIQARVLTLMPSAAICWTTYEYVKFLLTDDT